MSTMGPKKWHGSEPRSGGCDVCGELVEVTKEFEALSRRLYEEAVRLWDPTFRHPECERKMALGLVPGKSSGRE